MSNKIKTCVSEIMRFCSICNPTFVLPLFQLSYLCNSSPVVDVIKLFLEEFWKIYISPKAETAIIAILKAINSFRVLICLKLALFSHFSASSDTRKTFFHFLILGKSRSLLKKVLQHQLLVIYLFFFSFT